VDGGRWRVVVGFDMMMLMTMGRSELYFTDSSCACTSQALPSFCFFLFFSFAFPFFLHDLDLRGTG